MVPFLCPRINDKTSCISEMFYSTLCEGISLSCGEYISANEVMAFSLLSHEEKCQEILLGDIIRMLFLAGFTGLTGVPVIFRSMMS